MTIKRRLFISNLLMIIIPIIAYLVFTAGASIAVVRMYTNNPDLPMLSEEYLAATFSDYSEYIPHVTVLWLGVFTLMAVIVFITGRMLARTMTKNIITPLNTLVFGVTQIRDNKLGFRLNYHTEDEFRPVCEAFNEMASRLEMMVAERQKDEESRRELIAGISHDIRTPLTSIKAYLEGIETGVAAAPEQRQRYFTTINGKVRDLEHIINQLFLFTKLDVGEFPINEQKIEIGPFLRELIKGLAREYEPRGLVLIRGGSIPGMYVCVDPVLFRGVIINILENSVKYKDTEQGRIKIECAGDGDNTGVEIRLTDDGPGVPKEILGKLFDVFYRADPSRNTRNTRGTGQSSGLGLAISEKMIRRMGGAIRAEPGFASEGAERRGLAIVIHLPAAKGPEP
ncbi:MAG: HAMP domain-containing histidine kinase [Spirochaetaceae bacterium]|jgi:signal transduction histidine kinase|nr:HAMP domain-containing histidine kinase [Spirochaetaceae bacterium]